jgi:hypothetical protein
MRVALDLALVRVGVEKLIILLGFVTCNIPRMKERGDGLIAGSRELLYDYNVDSDPDFG